MLGIGVTEMAAIIDKKAKSLGEILRATKQIARKWTPTTSDPEELWFRGQPQKRYELLPGLYRPDNSQFNYDEDSLFERFKVRGQPFVGTTINSDWDWLFLAQHHKLVTRLLDWTTSLLAAIYFALSQYMEMADRRSYDAALSKPLYPSVYDDSSPTVWVMEAGSLNVFSCQNQDEDYVFVPGGDYTSKYLPTAIQNYKTDNNRYPLAILPPYSNVRLTAQQGVFTIHGHEDCSIDAFAALSGKFKIKLARIILDRANLHHLWAELEVAGVNRLMLFPELDSVAYVTKWIGQYKS